MTQHHYIVLEDVSHWYGDLHALEDVTLSVQAGEFATIIGPSGCGKSTLLTILSGLIRPSQGRVLVGGKDLYASRSNAIRVGYIFQEPRLLPWKTVRENVLFALRSSGIPPVEWDERVDHHLAQVGLQDFKDAWPLTLSGGMRQRVSIARTLAIDPTYILMDEPYSTLDEMTARVAREDLLRLWRETRKTIIFITHSISEAVFMSDRVYFMTPRPGSIFRRLSIDVPRPRDYESLDLARIEADVVKEVLAEWGYSSRDQGPHAVGPSPGPHVAQPESVRPGVGIAPLPPAGA